jgi:hypothetical protein
MNVLAAAVARIMRINPTTLEAYNDALLLVNGVYKPTQIAPHRGLSSNLAVLACENGIAAALPAAYYCTLVIGNNNSPVSLSRIRFHSRLLHPGNILES